MKKEKNQLKLVEIQTQQQAIKKQLQVVALILKKSSEIDDHKSQIIQKDGKKTIKVCWNAKGGIEGKYFGSNGIKTIGL